MRFKNQQLPRLTLALALLALATWGWCILYTLYWNPEIRFYKGAALRKLEWVKQLHQQPGPNIIVAGDSSCSFSIHSQHLLQQHGLKVANLGLHAGMGPKVMILFARDQVRPGDTLILNLATFLLSQPFEPPSLGLQFSFAMDQAQWATDAAIPGGHVSTLSFLLNQRPGGYHAFTLLGKILLKQPLYRYRVEEVDQGGMQRTALRWQFDPAGHPDLELSEDAKGFLQYLKQWCDQHQVRVAFSLPWTYVPDQQVPAFQAANARVLLQIAEFLPVLKDPRLGTFNRRDCFADTALHLTEEGAVQRSDALAEQIKLWQCWTKEELKALSRPEPYSQKELEAGDQNSVVLSTAVSKAN